ncbi:MAG: prolyl oligopeptidase family serine peptidase [Acidobacteriia bacterium]|nr:prolyl oligopeptidase family serine peptidase [Terriglobia bacterium]
MQVTTARYGSWRSPITSEFIVAQSIGLSDVQLDGRDTYWVESRPAEAGRSVIVKCAHDGSVTDMVPAPLNARTRVHEYGGGAYGVSQGAVFFCNFSDQKIYRVGDGGPQPLTVDGLRYADLVIDHPRKRLIAVQEDHRASENEPVNSLVVVGFDGSPHVTLASGRDFYSSPRLSPDGRSLAWLSWNHPNMPWDGTELWVAELSTDGALTSERLIAGGAGESVFQPEWSPGGVLHFVSDRTGWWNLYRAAGGETAPLLSMEAEFGMPQWVFGMSCYSFVSEGQIACAWNHSGLWSLGLLDARSQQLRDLGIAGRDFSCVRAAADRIVVRAGAPDKPAAILQVDLPSGTSKVLKKSAPFPGAELQPFLSVAHPYEFPVGEGEKAYAFFYPPRNPEFSAPSGDRPPLLVKSHGGPTAAVTSTLDLRTQYWTSRGYAVLDVNYGGSTGYGRRYRDRLKGQWGVVDVEDCVKGAQALAAQGLVDGKRMMITGGSAGGYTVLCALAFHKVFSGGASHFGVSDLEAMTRDTHKFESRYLESLVAPYPAEAGLYQRRSPVHFARQITAPVIFFQGEDDKIVPPNQTEMMVDALRAQGLPAGYMLFAGEGHGFRRGDNIKRALDGEFSFYDAVVVKAGLRF